MVEQYKYEFSVVMAVYNVEKYLRETVDSLIHQTIGFSHIQLIMVDDGSKDKSGEICDEYKGKYPNNVVVIHKENGGVSSARNAGISFVKGKYLNFMDSDDKMDPSTFKEVLKCFEKYGEKTDVIAIPMKYFEAQKGDHKQNQKFEINEDVIDLYKYPYVTNLSTSSSFFRVSAVSGICFDTNLASCEDAKYALRVLMKKMTLGLCRKATYWYRKRSSGSESATQSSVKNKSWYIPHLVWFSIWSLEEANKVFGMIPQFVQYEVMYDLQWKFEQSKMPDSVLTDEEISVYKSLLYKALSMIDDEVILKQRNLNVERKCLLIRHKHNTIISLVPKKASCRIQKNITPEIGDIELFCNNYKMTTVSALDTTLDFITLKNDECVLEGYHHVLEQENHEIKPVVLVNGAVFYCEQIERENNAIYTLGEKTSSVIGFKGIFPLRKADIKVVTGLEVDGIIIPRHNVKCGNFFPVTPVYENTYALIGQKELHIKGSSIIIRNKSNIIVRAVRETSLLLELWKRDLLGGRKAIAGRLFYHLAMPLKRKQLWIISDRIMKADDNGEALFRYLIKHRPDNTDIVFAISKQSNDYVRMKRIGRCVSAMSFKHKLLHLLCDVVVSSHADGVTRNPYYGHDDGLRDLLSHQKYVFLQHGITKDDVSGWLNKYKQNINGFVTAAKPEWTSILEGDYYYTKNQVWLTGFPRYDRLYHNEKKVITLMPTWRRYLMELGDATTGMWTLPKNFEQSSYYCHWDELINSERLLETLTKYGYAIQFMPHPTLQPHVNRFRRDPRVKFLSLDTSYRKVYAESNLVITDYSSAVFDFAYLRKPIIYYQFDRDEFFAGEHVFTKGYFDYERDGLGEVTYTMDDTIDLIIDYVKNDCMMKDKYRERADKFFAFNDKDNCKRVVNRIIELLKE